MPSTFSIVARDAESGDLGVAVQSKFPAVGAVVPWARADVGAVATQALANASYGPRGLAYLHRGHTAGETVDWLVSRDQGRDHRQVGVVDGHGRAAAYTGAACLAWAGHAFGDGYACQGNILASEAVVGAMSVAFEGARGEPLAHRLLRALEAGQAVGGDRRGQQSASLLVVRAGGGYGGTSDRMVDLRVDDHRTPIQELRRLLAVHELLLGRTRSQDELPLEGERLAAVQEALTRLGHWDGAAESGWFAALLRWVGVENLEERTVTAERIDRLVYEHLLQQAADR